MLIDGKVSTRNSFDHRYEVKAQKELVPPLSGEPVLDATRPKNLNLGVQGSALKSANPLQPLVLWKERAKTPQPSDNT